MSSAYEAAKHAYEEAQATNEAAKARLESASQELADICGPYEERINAIRDEMQAAAEAADKARSEAAKAARDASSAQHAAMQALDMAHLLYGPVPSDDIEEPGEWNDIVRGAEQYTRRHGVHNYHVYRREAKLQDDKGRGLRYFRCGDKDYGDDLFIAAFDPKAPEDGFIGFMLWDPSAHPGDSTEADAFVQAKSGEWEHVTLRTDGSSWSRSVVKPLTQFKEALDRRQRTGSGQPPEHVLVECKCKNHDQVEGQHRMPYIDVGNAVYFHRTEDGGVMVEGRGPIVHTCKKFDIIEDA